MLTLNIDVLFVKENGCMLIYAIVQDDQLVLVMLRVFTKCSVGVKGEIANDRIASSMSLWSACQISQDNRDMNLKLRDRCDGLAGMPECFQKGEQNNGEGEKQA